MAGTDSDSAVPLDCVLSSRPSFLLCSGYLGACLSRQLVTCALLWPSLLDSRPFRSTSLGFRGCGVEAKQHRSGILKLGYLFINVSNYGFDIHAG